MTLTPPAPASPHRTAPSARRLSVRALLPGLALLIGACATVAPPQPATPTTPSAPAPETPVAPASLPSPSASNARTAGAEMLTIEQRWLQDWFRGTPVRIVQRSDGTLTVDVPREFSFDVGRSQVKPALGAVLDKVAESLRRRPGTRLALITAPGDPAAGAGPATLALQRAAGVQRHLRDRGIAPARLAEPAAEGSTSVQLRIVALAP